MYWGCSLLPFLINVPEEDDYYRKRMAIGVPSHPKLITLFGTNIPEIHVYRDANRYWVETGCYHRNTNLLVGCLRGAASITMRLTQSDGTSWHKIVSLSEKRPEFLAIPMGVWYALATRGSWKNSLLVCSSRVSQAPPDVDEFYELPAGYDMATSRDFAIETVACLD